MKKRLILLLWVFAECSFTYAQWQLTGNSILSTNFLGSTNAQPLVFKVNNQRSGLLDYDINKANSAFGYQSLLSNTGYENTAIGYLAHFTNTSGSRNVATGSYALYGNSTGVANVGNGYSALFYNTTGSFNTGIGGFALYWNINGTLSTATGYNSLYNNSSGSNNTANGAYALYNNTIGNNNTASGYQALYTNTTTSDLTAYGHQALYSNTSGEENTASGYRALFSNTSGTYNTATGYEALFSNTTGIYNAAVGAEALKANITGDFNTAFGALALSNNNGSLNTAIGAYSSYSNTTGERNTAVGYNSLYSNTTGNFNTAIGDFPLNLNTTGSQNTAVGSSALNNNTTGSNNTALGLSADGGPANSGMSNCTLIGFTAGGTNAGTNKVCIGNTSVTSIKGQVNFSTYSDERFKTNIQPQLHGLDFINRLNPITYTVDIDRLNHFIYGSKSDTLFDDISIKKSIETNSKIIYSGFSAQQVEQVANDVKYEFSGVDKPENPDISPYGLRYSEFIVPLVKAVQELTPKNDSLKAANQQLKIQLATIEQRIAALEFLHKENKSLLQSTPAMDVAKLDQTSTTNNAQGTITGINSQNLKNIAIYSRGLAQIIITANIPYPSIMSIPYSLMGRKLTVSR